MAICDRSLCYKIKGLKDKELDLSVSHCCQIVCRGGYMAMQWHITVEAGVQSQASPCRICCGHSGIGRVVSFTADVLPHQYLSMPIQSCVTGTTQYQHLMVSFNKKHKNRSPGNNNMAFEVVSVVHPEDCT